MKQSWKLKQLIINIVQKSSGRVVTLFLLPLGIYLKYLDVAAGNLVFATGTLGILIYYSVSLVIDVTKKRGNKLLYALKLLL